MIGAGTRDQVFLQSFGSPPRTVAVDQRAVVGGISRAVNQPSIHDAIYQQGFSYPFYTQGMDPSIWKANFDVTAQGRRASNAARSAMLIDPRDNPSRSQFVEGYTRPMQLFASANTWQIPVGKESSGNRLRQPSLKVVSPFSASAPIVTKMPWDL